MTQELTLEELKSRLVAKYDPEELLEALGLADTDILVEVLTDYIQENYDKVLEAVGDDDFSTYQQPE